MIPELFEPPLGDFRTIPDMEKETYYIKYRELGPFQKHKYDLDICVLYRQVVDMKGRYDKIGHSNYAVFLENIKENVGHDLKALQLDEEFYLNNFYCVIDAANSSYFSYLGLFFALSNPLDLIPKLEYHLEQYNRFKNDEDGSIEYFLGELEYAVCNYLRTLRFPEDYFVKHESIIRWIYSRRDFYFYQHHLHKKMDILIAAINRAIPKPIPDILLTAENHKKQKREAQICVIESMRDVLFDDISSYFNEKNHDKLRDIIAGNAGDSEKIIFKGQVNQLMDIFRIYSEEKFIISDKRSIARWAREHFMCMSDSKDHPEIIAEDTSEKVIYKGLRPIKSKRIPLHGLENLRDSYYKRKK